MTSYYTSYIYTIYGEAKDSLINTNAGKVAQRTYPGALAIPRSYRNSPLHSSYLIDDPSSPAISVAGKADMEDCEGYQQTWAECSSSHPCSCKNMTSSDRSRDGHASVWAYDPGG